MAILGSFFSVIISLAVLVLTIASWWVLYMKMGEPGWKVLIPFYGEYTLFKRVWKPMVYFWYLLASAVLFAVYVYLMVSFIVWINSFNGAAAPAVSGYIVACILGFVSMVATVVISFMRNLKIAKCFGHGIGYCLGITFLPVVFIPILAFGSDCYVPVSQGSEV